ncbi:unnamed protein product, partial [marine sediment metagenome]
PRPGIHLPQDSRLKKFKKHLSISRAQVVSSITRIAPEPKTSPFSPREGKEDDIDLILHTAKVMQKTSLCALGQSLILPISTILKYFRKEVAKHI